MASHPRAAWVRLGELLVRRRIELDPRYRNRRAFTSERAVEYRIVNDAELGKRDNYEPGTIAALEVAYALAPGSIGRALDGGELEPQSAALPRLVRSGTDQFPAMTSQVDAESYPHFREIEARIAVARIAHPDGPLAGAAVFPDLPVDAARWDGLASKDWSDWELAKSVSVMRVLLPAPQSDSGDAAAVLREPLRRCYSAGRAMRSCLQVTSR